MQTTSTNAAQLIERNDPSLNPMTRIVRTDSAVDAQGFAQILQAFDTGAESKQLEAAKEAELREQAVADTDEQGEVTDDTGEIEEQAAKDSSSSEQPSSDTDEQASSDRQAANDEAAADTNPSDADADASSASDKADAADQPKTQGQDAQAASGPASQSSVAGEGTPAGEQPSLNQETTMRLLDQQSEQAKLTIKGVARSLTHAADVSVSSRAVDTRLGQDQAGAPMTKEQAQVSQPAPQPAPPPAAQPQNPPQGPVYDQGSTPPDPARTTSMPNGPTHLHTPDPSAKPVDAQADQSNSNAQQARSQRAESAIGVVSSNAKPNTATQAPSAASLQAVGLGKQGSAQTVRAVSSVDAGLIGKDQTNAQPGSLVEKMKGASLPNQANHASVLAQVQRGLASMLRSGNNDMTLKLTPGHLGSLKIQLKSEGSKLQVRFETTNSQASEHLSESVKDLGASLRSKGISLDKIEIQQQSAQNAETTTADGQQGESGSSQQNSDERQSANQSHQQTQQDQAISDGELVGDEPESIWTELGLDATA